MTPKEIAPLRQTIYALASGRGVAGVAVIRLSGPESFAALAALTNNHAQAKPRQMVRRDLFDPESGDLLDRAMAVRFAAPASFTGEDVVELFLHGGRAVIEAVIAACGSIAGLRMAEPGEFTKRAFLNGKLDLLKAEALNDLVQAETTAQRRQALGQYDGRLGEIYDDWRDRLIKLAAYVEAEIDFTEEDLPAELGQSVVLPIVALKTELERHLADGRRGERLREGVSIAILGAPNVGKSSLLNALADRDVAIVSEIAGTTRDVIDVHLDIGGYPVIVADTAGLRKTADRVEDEGIRRALARAEAADLKILLADGPESASSWPHELEQIPAADIIRVVNKSDLNAGLEKPAPLWEKALAISAKTGDGLDTLLNVLEQQVASRFDQVGTVWLTRQRHRELVASAANALSRAADGTDIELIAEDLRLAIRDLGRITGRVDVEDILDVIFAEFCIGK
jgi:tRNA modification GTPase